MLSNKWQVRGGVTETGARGAKTVNGLGMLVNQAAVNFTLWTGKAAPEALMARALRAEFGLE